VPPSFQSMNQDQINVKRIQILAAVVLSFATVAKSQEIQAPTLTPTPQSDKHRDLMREGIALHDRGEFDAAIKKYREVLAENPNDVETIYEMGFSYFAKGDYKTSLDVGRQGARYKSRFLSGFYTLIGNNLDHLGQGEKAINVYREGIKQFPDDGQLHYNLAITLLGKNQRGEAIKSLKRAAQASPAHASTHLALSQLYLQDNYQIPALLAACRFLVIEPRSSRSRAVLQLLNQVMQSSVQPGKDPNNITIFLDPKSKTDEGDFNVISTALAMVAAGRHLEKNKDKTEAQLFSDQLSSLFAIMSEGSEKSSGFAWDYYRPYFCELSRRKMAEPFCYYILQSLESNEVDTWLERNADKVRGFLKWTRSYSWGRR
jgi:lipopolysaccharide biosynthesis regulator YciM